MPETTQFESASSEVSQAMPPAFFTSPSLDSSMIRLERKKLLEAALYMAPRTISAQALRLILGVHSDEEVISLATELKQEYEQHNTSIEIHINTETKEFSMRVRMPYLERVKHLAVESGLSKGVQKTLAMISYKQPIKQSEVIRYRNNKGYDHVKELEELGFIARERKGRSFLLRTTRKFLDYFGSLTEEQKSELKQQSQDAVQGKGEN